MAKRAFWTVFGFILFFLGFLSLVFHLFAGGLSFSFLRFLDAFGPVAGFIIRLVMLFGGIVIFYVARTDNDVD